MNSTELRELTRKGAELELAKARRRVKELELLIGVDEGAELPAATVRMASPKWTEEKRQAASDRMKKFWQEKNRKPAGKGKK